MLWVLAEIQASNIKRVAHFPNTNMLFINSGFDKKLLRLESNTTNLNMDIEFYN